MLLDTRTVVILFEVIGHQIDGRIGSRLESKRTADRVHVTVVKVAASSQVFRVTIAFQIEAGNARTDRFANRQVEHALGFHAIEVAVFELSFARKAGQIRFCGDDVHNA